jgi:hypothetical protein
MVKKIQGVVDRPRKFFDKNNLPIDNVINGRCPGNCERISNIARSATHSDEFLAPARIGEIVTTIKAASFGKVVISWFDGAREYSSFILHRVILKLFIFLCILPLPDRVFYPESLMVVSVHYLSVFSEIVLFSDVIVLGHRF